jgi:hypothetical protein
MKKHFKNLLLLLLVFLAAQASYAQIRFYAETNAKEVLSGSYFEIKFVIKNDSGNGFKAPDLSSFTVVSGPNQSSHISIVNGRRSQSKSYGYTLLAGDPGVYKIGSAEIVSNRTKIYTDPIEVKVVKGKNLVNGSQDKDVFVRAEISDSIVYPGQQILLRYVLYTQIQVRGFDFLSDPNYEGFYTQAINTRNQAQLSVIDGVEYKMQVLQTIALFPQKLGELKIDPVQVSLGIVQRNDPFSFFQGSTKQFPVITNENSVIVKALPPDAPESFNGALGSYKLETSLNKRFMTTDDAVSFNVKITGNGLSKFIEPPNLDLGSKFQVYDPKVINENIYASGEDIFSEKTFEYLLVPMETGRQKIKLRFSYFDTDSSKYISLSSPDYYVEVKPGENSKKSLSPEEFLMKYQLQPPMVDNKTSRLNHYFFGSLYYWSLIVLLLLSFPVIFLLKHWKIKQGNIDPKITRRKRASKEAMKRLQRASELLAKNMHKSFYEEISDALLKYAVDKFSIPTKDLSKDKIVEALLSKGVAEGLCTGYHTVLSKCELALYAGTGEKGTKELYQKSKELLESLEIHLNKK